MAYLVLRLSILYRLKLVWIYFTPLDFAQRYGFDDIVLLLNTPRTKLLAQANERTVDTPKSGMSLRDTERKRGGSSFEKTINELLQINE